MYISSRYSAHDATFTGNYNYNYNYNYSYNYNDNYNNVNSRDNDVYMGGGGGTFDVCNDCEMRNFRNIYITGSNAFTSGRIFNVSNVFSYGYESLTYSTIGNVYNGGIYCGATWSCFQSELAQKGPKW